jgi:hypothetical protein
VTRRRSAGSTADPIDITLFCATREVPAPLVEVTTRCRQERAGGCPGGGARASGVLGSRQLCAGTGWSCAASPDQIGWPVDFSDAHLVLDHEPHHPVSGALVPAEVQAWPLSGQGGLSAGTPRHGGRGARLFGSELTGMVKVSMVIVQCRRWFEHRPEDRRALYVMGPTITVSYFAPDDTDPSLPTSDSRAASTTLTCPDVTSGVAGYLSARHRRWTHPGSNRNRASVRPSPYYPSCSAGR